MLDLVQLGSAVRWIFMTGWLLLIHSNGGFVRELGTGQANIRLDFLVENWNFC